MADLKLGIGIIAEMKDFEEKLATLPDIGAKEARDMVTGIRRELKNAEKAAAGSAKGMSTSFSGEFNKISSGAAALGSQLGGPFARIASVANSALKPISEVGLGLDGATGAAVGAAGAAAGVVAGFAAVGLVARSMADAAVEAEGRLDKLGIAIGPDARDGIDSYKDATADLSIAMDQLTVAVGGEIAGDLAHLTEAAAGGIRAFLDARDAIAPYREEVELFARAGLAIVTLGATEAARATIKLAEANDQSAIATEGHTEKQQMEIESQQAIIEGTRQQALADKADAEAKRLAAEATAKATKAASEYAAMMGRLQQEDQKLVASENARQAATEQLTGIYDSLHESQLGPAQKIQADLDAQLEKIAKLGDESGDYDAAWKAAGEATEVAKDKLHDYQIEHQRTIDDAARNLDDLISSTQLAANEAATAADNALKQMSKDTQKAILQDAQQLAGMFGSLLGDLSSFYQGVEEKDLALGQQQIDTAKKAAAAWKEGQDALVDKLLASGQISAGEHTRRIWEIDQESKARASAGRKQAQAELDAARQAFNLSQAAQISQAIMATALAEIQAFAQLGPVAGAIAAPILATELGFQIAAIRGQKAPSYPGGGMVDPDHHMVAVQNREAVLNRRAVVTLGEDTIRALNEGRSSGATSVTVVLDRRTLAEAVADAGVARPRQRVGKRIYRRRHP